MVLHVCLVNLLNHTTNEKNELCKSITSQSTRIGYQGIKIRTETMNVADNWIRTESCNLSLSFCIIPNAYNGCIKNLWLF